MFMSVGLALVLGSAAAFAWTVHDQWCQRFDCGWYNGCSQSFTDRGLDYVAVMEELNMGAAWWSEVEAGFRFSTPGPYCDSSFNNDDPGAVQGRCSGESSGGIFTDHFPTDALAHTWWTTRPSATCWSNPLYMKTWRMAILTNADGLDCHAPAPSNRGWAFNKAEQSLGSPALFQSAAHEFGHVIGLDHSTDPNSLMYAGGSSQHMNLSYDDANGVYWGLGEMPDLKPLKTVKATLSGTTLTFGSTQTISGTNLLWGPAIAADHPTYDFVIAWADGTDYGIRLGLANQNSNGNLGTMTTKLVYPETSRAPVGLAVTPDGKIGVAFTGTDYSKTVNFVVSSDNGTTWTKTTLWGYGALGGVALTYHPSSARWVMSWVADRPYDPYHRNIFLTISDDASGANWHGPVWNYGDVLTMPFGRPSLACARNTYMPQRDKCMMLFKTYATYTKRTQSVAFQMDSSGYALNALANPQDFDGGKHTYMTTNLFYVMPGDGLSPGKYVALYVPYALSPGGLSYAVKSEDELGSGNFGFPAAKTWSNGPTTRSGFAGTYSERKRVVRLVWKDQ
jgi:hypothetical protein